MQIKKQVHIHKVLRAQKSIFGGITLVSITYMPFAHFELRKMDFSHRYDNKDTLKCLKSRPNVYCVLFLQYFTCLLLILIAQVAAAVLIYFQRNLLRTETSNIVTKLLENYNGQNKTAEQAWDYIQRNMRCCGWTTPEDWMRNPVIVNSTQMLYPCSCRNTSVPGDNGTNSGFCEAQSDNWPNYDTGCMISVESWLFTNYGVILGICLGVAVIELLGMILSMGLCKSVHQEDYTKVPKY
uniref:CD82 molecule a n=1 Tax=Astyanax mexicanus TaxID=7994 RepID=A0A8B9HAN4_ASTMX